MNSNHFEKELMRLIEAFGKAAYPRVRTALIWKAVQGISDQAFTSIVDELIGSCRYAPLVPEFEEKLSRYREQSWKYEKQQHKEDAEEFMSIYAAEDIQMICANIRKRLAGHISDSDWECQQRLLNSAPTLGEKKTPFVPADVKMA